MSRPPGLRLARWHSCWSLRARPLPRQPSNSRPADSRAERKRVMAQQIAVINAGSSSIKFAIFNQERDLTLLFRGQVEGIGVAPRLSVQAFDGAELVEKELPGKEADHRAATSVILETSIALLGGEAVEGIGHRVVHGGTQFTAPTLVTKEVQASLLQLCPLAPLHQPHNLAPIEAISTVAPHIP